MMINTKTSIIVILAFILLAMLLLPSIAQNQPSNNNTNEILKNRSQEYRDILNRIKPSIVEINVNRYSEEKLFTEDVLAKLDKIRSYKNPEFSQRPKNSVTGFVISSDGFIATSNFNVSGRIKEINVKFPDGRELPARIAGVNEKHDLAILQVKADDLVVPEFSSTEAKSNTNIAAISANRGNGLYFDSGKITSSVEVQTKYYLLDINSNFGNSGAAIINNQGEIIGMLNLISTKSCFEFNHGIGFSLPISTILKDAESLKKSLSITLKDEQYMGLTFMKSMIENNKLVISNVFPNTGSAFCDIKIGDEINRINGVLIAPSKKGNKVLTIMEVFLNELGKNKIGDEINVTLIRNNQILNKSVILTEKWLNIGY